VPDSEPADKLLVTSLIQTTLPFLRYELTDAVTLLDTGCECGSPMRLIADIAGRADDDFDYPGAGQVPAAAFRHALSKVPTVEEYQVGQTERGAIVTYLGSVTDPAALSARIEAELRTYGLAAPEVTLRAADRLPRDPRTGKLRRFVPLPRR
jgi:phenylacetate-coenzyme A ligase PaaK-like adenylate-forming protein